MLMKKGRKPYGMVNFEEVAFLWTPPKSIQRIMLAILRSRLSHICYSFVLASHTGKR